MDLLQVDVVPLAVSLLWLHSQFSRSSILPLRATYQYSAATHASCPAGVLVPPDFHMLVEKSIEDICFRFAPLDSPMFVVSVTVFSFLQAVLVLMLGAHKEHLRNKLF